MCVKKTSRNKSVTRSDTQDHCLHWYKDSVMITPKFLHAENNLGHMADDHNNITVFLHKNRSACDINSSSLRILTNFILNICT